MKFLCMYMCFAIFVNRGGGGFIGKIERFSNSFITHKQTHTRANTCGKPPS